MLVKKKEREGRSSLPTDFGVWRQVRFIITALHGQPMAAKHLERGCNYKAFMLA